MQWRRGSEVQWQLRTVSTAGLTQNDAEAMQLRRGTLAAASLTSFLSGNGTGIPSRWHFDPCSGTNWLMRYSYVG